ncbi:MAG: sulfotransferase domain-containing protein, partial [Pseudomonadota bacterium]
GNILRTRLLQKFFPDSAFIILTRHPVAQLYGVKKWVANIPNWVILTNWVVAHQVVKHDTKFLKRVHFMSYESLINNHDDELIKLSRFIGLDLKKSATQLRPHVNQSYFEKWRDFRRNNLISKLYAIFIESLFGPLIKRWGYSFSEVLRTR